MRGDTMRNEPEIIAKITEVARQDDTVRAVIRTDLLPKRKYLRTYNFYFVVNDIEKYDVFGEKRNLNEKELNSIDVIKGNKTDNTFYISLLKIYFFNTKGSMHFKYKDIISQYSNENSKE